MICGVSGAIHLSCLTCTFSTMWLIIWRLFLSLYCFPSLTLSPGLSLSTHSSFSLAFLSSCSSPCLLLVSQYFLVLCSSASLALLILAHSIPELLLLTSSHTHTFSKKQLAWEVPHSRRDFLFQPRLGWQVWYTRLLGTCKNMFWLIACLAKQLCAPVLQPVVLCYASCLSMGRLFLHLSCCL